MSRPEDCLTIVAAMGEEYLPRFTTFRDGIAPNLQPTAQIDGDAFTSHGYDHCVRIFRELNNLLDGHSPFWADIKPEELFCLALATLLHDLVMTTHPRLRATHSDEAQRIIREEFEKTKGALAAFHLSDPVVDAIADIVYAHSDLKGPGGQVIERTLEAVKDQEQSGDSGRIRTYLLAALLRFGDELDCTSQRIHDAQRSLALEQVAKSPDWRACELIREVKPPQTARTDIMLKVNDLALKESDDKANDLALINKTLQKLRVSLEEVQRVVFAPKNISWWHYNTVRLSPESEELIAQIESQDPLGTAIPSEPTPIREPIGASAGAAPAGTPGAQEQSEQTEDVAAADIGMSRKLKEWVLDRKMLKSGHFSMSPQRHARDWIDTSQLLEDSTCLGQIVNSFIGILRQRGLLPENAVLVGAGFPGLIIASQMSFVGGYGCSYMVPVHGGGEEEKYSKLPDIPQQKGVVLVADVIAEGETLSRVLDCLRVNYGVSSEQVLAILVVFFRRPTRARAPMTNAIKERLVPLNTGFPIELCEKAVDDCVLYGNRLVEVINEELGQ